MKVGDLVTRLERDGQSDELGIITELTHDFEIDEEAEDFKLRNPSGVATSKIRNDRDMDSDQEDDYDDIENNLGASGFSKTHDLSCQRILIQIRLKS